MVPYARVRRVLSFTLLGFGALVVVAGLVRGFTSEPSQGDGWIGGVVEAVFAGGPLLVIGFGLRSGDRELARRTGIAAAILAALVALMLLMQLIDPNETAADRLLQVAGVAAYVAAFVVELPAFGDHWPAKRRGAPATG